ncbi:MAG: homoserine kinase [Bacteroidota bacterium]
MSSSLKVFAPATVANVGPGFDILGLALNHVGDQLELSLRNEPGITIEMPGSDLPTDPKLNVAGVSVQGLLDQIGTYQGIHLIIHKNVAPGSGLGSSASSAAGAVFGANELLGAPLSKYDLVKFAMMGEAVASGKAHADNVAPSLLGGFTLIRNYYPLEVVNLSFPKELTVVIIHPQIEVKTSDSKRILRKDIPLEVAIKQWGNVAGLVSGLASGDYELIGKSLEDVIVEPVRSMLIPGFDELKAASKDTGALGCSISGSGPSVFALCSEETIGQKTARSFEEVYANLGIDYEVYISTINEEGAKIISK